MFKIKVNTLKKLNSYDLNLDHLYYLTALEKSELLDLYKVDSSIIQELFNRGLILNNKLTKTGKELLDLILCKGAKKIQHEFEVTKKFNEFWEAFPKTDQSRHHPATRKFKVKKEECLDVYASLLKEGYKHEDIMKGLKNEINFRIHTTTSDSNGFKYMRGTLPWLNTKTFLDYQEDCIEIQEGYNDTLL